jgi:apolipoprotein N-acyltransferase
MSTSTQRTDERTKLSWRSAALSIAAGLSIGLAGAPLSFSFLAFLAPAALMVAIEGLRDRDAIVCGFLMGFATSTYSMYWVVGLLITFGGFPFVAALLVGSLLWAGQAVSFVIAAWLAAASMRNGAAGWLAVPAVMTVATSLIPAIFPWRIGVSQMEFIEYVQIAELGGLPLVDLALSIVSCGALTAIRTRKLAPAIAAVIALVLPITYGAIRIREVRAERARAPSLAVGIVQPNIGIFEKHDPRLHFGHLRLLRAMTRELERDGAELVLWPESAYPFGLDRDATEDPRGSFGIAAEGVRGPVLTGVITTDGRRRFNSAVGIEDGRVCGIADKVQLLAFGEYVPFWDWIPPLQRFPRGLTPGEGPQVIRMARADVGVLNCYEDLLADHVRGQAAASPSFWANLTNNAWFGDTSAPHLHHLLARARAIETRRDLVRAVNTGVSGHTLATGEDAVRTDAFTRASFLADVRLLSGTTAWVRWGDWPTAGLLGALFGFVLARRRATLAP